MPKKHSFIFGLSLLACLFNNAAEETAWTLERLFDREKVHTFQLEIEPDDWDTIRYQRRDFATALSEDRKQGERPSPYTKVEAQLTIDDFNWGTVSVRKKGFLGSNDSDRPSIKVDLNDYQPGRSIERLSQLTLNNNKQDRSLMSQFMGYELYHRAGLPAPRIAHAEVIVNGQSLGVYSHVETPKESFLDHLYGESSGSLYEGTVTDFWPDWINSFEAKTKQTSESREPIRRLIAALEAPKKQRSKRLEEVIDLEGFLKFWALESLIGFWDGYAANKNNFFLYQPASRSKMQFIPWGLDSAFTPPQLRPARRLNSVHAGGRVANLLYEDPLMRDRYRTTMLALLDQLWDENQLAEDMNEAFARIQDKLHPSQKRAKHFLKETLEFVHGRRKIMLGDLRDSPPEPIEKLERPFYFGVRGHLEASFSTTWENQPSVNPLGKGNVSVDLELGGMPIELKTIGVSATPGAYPGAKGKPTITIAMQQTNPTRLFILYASFDPDDGETQGTLARDVRGLFFSGVQDIRIPVGQLRLKRFSQKKGETIKGSLRVALRDSFPGQ